MERDSLHRITKQHVMVGDEDVEFEESMALLSDHISFR